MSSICQSNSRCSGHFLISLAHLRCNWGVDGELNQAKCTECNYYTNFCCENQSAKIPLHILSYRHLIKYSFDIPRQQCDGTELLHLTKHQCDRVRRRSWTFNYFWVPTCYFSWFVVRLGMARLGARSEVEQLHFKLSGSDKTRGGGAESVTSWKQECCLGGSNKDGGGKLANFFKVGMSSRKARIKHGGGKRNFFKTEMCCWFWSFQSYLKGIDADVIKMKELSICMTTMI
jgi:hypothetical protein